MIQIAFCTDDNYIIPTGVLIHSIELIHRDLEINYYVISQSLSEKSKDSLRNCLIKSNSNINFIFVNSDILSSCPVRLGDHITLAAYYKILFPTVLPHNLDKILYLDCDILCTDSLLELWNTDISNYSAGVVIDIYGSDIRRLNRLDLPFKHQYFNSGVMLINLDYWRKHNLQNLTLQYIENNIEKCIAHDQDALNKILSDTSLYLHPRYNFQLDFWQNPQNLLIDKSNFNLIEEGKKSPALLHFIGLEKPWHKECIYPMSKLWFLIISKTSLPYKITRRYKGKRLLKHILRNLLTKVNFVEDLNIYKNIDTSKLFKKIKNKYENNS